MREERYRAKFGHRGRGLADLARTVGGIVEDIEVRLARRQRVRVLELGCGFGTALLDLRQRFGDRVELHGVNRVPHDGDADVMRRTLRDRRPIHAGDTGDAGAGSDAPGDADLPSIAYADVAQGLPFADRSFDVVYSQVAWLYFGNKVGVIRDVMRVLVDGGVARIDADELRAGLPLEYARLVEIWQDGSILPFREYARRYGVALTAAGDGEHLHFGKERSFGDDLEPVLEIDLSTVYPEWDGIKCVYRVRPQRPPPQDLP
jgi:SAM-dependent methyltransferase